MKRIRKHSSSGSGRKKLVDKFTKKIFRNDVNCLVSLSSKGIFPTYKWHFFCSISPCALMVSLVNSFSMTGTPMLNVPFSMPSWMLFFSIVLERITGMEISTSFCFLIALLTLNPNYKMNMFCYKKQREMMKLSKMVTLVFSSLLLFIVVWFCKNVLVSGCKIVIIFPWWGYTRALHYFRILNPYF